MSDKFAESKLGEHYALLGLPYGEPYVKVQRAYRRLVRLNHPDRFRGDERLRSAAEEQMKRINDAHDVLKAHLKAQSGVQPQGGSSSTVGHSAPTGDTNSRLSRQGPQPRSDYEYAQNGPQPPQDSQSAQQAQYVGQESEAQPKVQSWFDVDDVRLSWATRRRLEREWRNAAKKEAKEKAKPKPYVRIGPKIGDYEVIEPERSRVSMLGRILFLACGATLLWGLASLINAIDAAWF